MKISVKNKQFYVWYKKKIKVFYVWQEKKYFTDIFLSSWNKTAQMSLKWFDVILTVGNQRHFKSFDIDQ